MKQPYRTLGAAFVGRAWHFSEVADQATMSALEGKADIALALAEV
jgi:hypothetical protein